MKYSSASQLMPRIPKTTHSPLNKPFRLNLNMGFLSLAEILFTMIDCSNGLTIDLHQFCGRQNVALALLAHSPIGPNVRSWWDARCSPSMINAREPPGKMAFHAVAGFT